MSIPPSSISKNALAAADILGAASYKNSANVFKSFSPAKAPATPPLLGISEAADANVFINFATFSAASIAESSIVSASVANSFKECTNGDICSPNDLILSSSPNILIASRNEEPESSIIASARFFIVSLIEGSIFFIPSIKGFKLDMNSDN